LKIYSYPEFLYEQSRNKKRIVIAGSHGKTTTTAIIIHVLKYYNWKMDYMVGSQIEGFENMVSISDEAEIAIFEGDEYLTSPIDPRPKFIHYKPHIALISGISWDHINVFPKFEDYVKQFGFLTDIIEPKGYLVYYSGDSRLKEISENVKRGIGMYPYTEHPSIIKEGITNLITNKGDIPLKIFGKHNLQNISGAKQVCNLLGLNDDDFYRAISSFPGTSKRLQVLLNRDNFTCYLDFAHAPSKVIATVQAVKEQFPSRRLIAVLELHTFSSLNRNFIPQYEGTMNVADEAIVFFNKDVLIHKKMEDLSEDFISAAFKKEGLKVISNTEKLIQYLTGIKTENTVLLLMSSGNFGGIKLKELVQSNYKID
jgi:UDP-N-acetylmuramate: L-alanyl-gamma-D-glutamyl-meso-diaminopimelate ligase